MCCETQTHHLLVVISVVTLNNRNLFLLYVTCEVQVGKSNLLTKVAQEATLTEARLPSDHKVSSLRGQEQGERSVWASAQAAQLSTWHWPKQVPQRCRAHRGLFLGAGQNSLWENEIRVCFPDDQGFWLLFFIQRTHPSPTLEPITTLGERAWFIHQSLLWLPWIWKPVS